MFDYSSCLLDEIMGRVIAMQITELERDVLAHCRQKLKAVTDARSLK